jgi:hypothetical protein
MEGINYKGCQLVSYLLSDLNFEMSNPKFDQVISGEQ